MSARTYLRRCVPNMGMALLLLVLCVGCTASVKAEDPFSNGRLLAENSILKKRLPLIERENDVLGKENLQYRSKINELTLRIKQLESELAALDAKYATDTAADAEKIQNLQQSIESIEKENAVRTEQLQAMNSALEKKRTQEVQALHEQIAKQEESFHRERDHLVQENAQREAKLSNELDGIKKTLNNKELELSSYKLAIGEISTRLGEAKALAEDMRKARDASLSELASVKAAHADLVKKMAAPVPDGASVPDSQPQADH
jgi:chromosome segregation ATPase